MSVKDTSGRLCHFFTRFLRLTLPRVSGSTEPARLARELLLYYDAFRVSEPRYSVAWGPARS